MNFDKRIDASVGNAMYPFEGAFQHGFQKTIDKGLIGIYDDYFGITRTAMRWNPLIFFHNMGIHASNRDYHVFGTGTTGAYSAAIEQIANEVTRYQEEYKNTLKPVIIMPTPTYGYFTKQPENLGFEVVYLPRDRNNDWAVDPEKLDALITEIHKDPVKRVVAYYDCNPNNPTGHIRDYNETRAIADVLIKHNEATEEFERNSASQQGKKYQWINQLHTRKIRVIDDLVYLGTEYNPDKKPFPFAALNNRCEKDNLTNLVFTVAGGSKIGLNGLRTGLLITTDSDRSKELFDKTRNCQYFAPFPNIFALEAVFPNSDNTELNAMRDAHLASLREAHQFSGNFLKALVNGIDSVQCSDEDRGKMIRCVSHILEISQESAKNILSDGIDGINVITSPESGFFHLLEFPNTNGKFYNNCFSHKQFSGAQEIKDDDDIEKLFGFGFGIKLCRGSFCGFGTEDMIMRCSYAFSPGTIVEMSQKLTAGMLAIQNTEELAEEYYSKKVFEALENAQQGGGRF